MDALFPSAGETPDKPAVNTDLEKMDPQVEGALATSMARVPTTKKGLPLWGDKFISLLEGVGGNTVAAAELIERDFSVVYKAQKDYPDLAHAVAEIKGRVDQQTLERLEARSVKNADDDKNTTERIFQLNALNSPKYRPKAGGTQVTAINITLGVQVPKSPDFSQAVEVPAAATVEPVSEEF